MMKHWLADVVASSDGTEVSADARRKLREYDIPLRLEPIESLEGMNGELTNVVFKSGPDLPRSGLFFSTGCHQGVRTFPNALAASVVQRGASLRTPRRRKPASPGCCG
jgi:hypothetical protein